MQMGSIRRCVPGGSNISQEIASLHHHAFLQAVRVAVKVPVVVAVNLLPVELINGQATANAGEELLHHSVIDGENGSAARRENINSAVASRSARLVKRVPKILGVHSLHRDQQSTLAEDVIIGLGDGGGATGL